MRRSDATSTSDQSKTMKFPEFSNKEDVDILAKSQNNFARDLYLTLARNSKGNLFFSPFSISAAMAMAHMGTGGNTEDEVKKVLNFSDDKDSIKRAFNDLISDFKQDVAEYELRTSNMAYISEKLSVLETFSSILQKSFLSSSKVVNFDNHEAVRNEINSIVEKETNSKIKDLIPQGILNALTRMVLVNAIYFKGLWLHQFDPKLTTDQKFWVSSDESVNVPMMRIEKDFRVAELRDLGARLLSMDYQGGRLSFVIVLPNERDGLAAVEQKLKDFDFASLDKRTATQKVAVTMPKFKLEESLDLVDTLRMMGIGDLFSESRCDFSGISEEKGLFVSNILHKAFLDINEEGSEAAAATVIAMNRMALVKPNPAFLADHPFHFYVRDRASDVILFAGRYAQP